MTLSFLPPLADAADFPAPRVPMTPYLEARRLLAPRAAVLPALAARGGILTVSGRAALGLIARQLIRAGDRVLLPAYHCPSLVEPFLAAGAAVDYYHVDATLNPKFDDFRQRLAVGARVVVFVHMFGFRQDTAACEVLARAAGASVVQDCAHALYALPGIAPTDYGIASLVKFCEVEEGGLLLAPRDLKLTAPHAARAMRDNLSLLSRAAARFKAADPDAGPARLRPQTQHAPAAPSANAAAAPRWRYFEPAACDTAVAPVTRALLARQPAAAAAIRRRACYRLLAEVVAGLSSARALYPVLPAGIVPYVFPLLLSRPQTQFEALRRLGIPLYRWEELVPTDCAISSHYRSALVQLPCHQGLHARHLDTLHSALRLALSDG